MPSIIRSLLFVPGSRPERFEKALNAGADLICIDLEDAVLPQDKDTARQAVVEFIKQHHNVCVRINPLSTALGAVDLAALASVNPQYVMLAKCADSQEIEQASAALQNCDSKLIALIETPIGLENAKEIARCQRVDALMFGGADMSAELRCQFAYEPLLFVRSQLVIAAASAGINLIDVPFINLKDNQGLIEETQKVQALGFTGKAAIHPNQVHTIHQAFAPTKAQVEYAQAVVDAVDGPDAGVVVVNGRMIDRPIILASEKVLQLAALSKDS